MARPTKLTEETIQKIIRGVVMGLPYKAAAQVADVGESTFYRWKQRGEEQESGQYREFREALKKAEGQAQGVLLG